ncbi:hypothetical protein DENSPDRAFT_855221, partial [Dentipellis sp. KUC8613]
MPQQGSGPRLLDPRVQNMREGSTSERHGNAHEGSAGSQKAKEGDVRPTAAGIYETAMVGRHGGKRNQSVHAARGAGVVWGHVMYRKGSVAGTQRAKDGGCSAMAMLKRETLSGDNKACERACEVTEREPSRRTCKPVGGNAALRWRCWGALRCWDETAHDGSHADERGRSWKVQRDGP